MSLLTLDGVACRRGNRMLFAGVSLSLEAGEALWLRGPNGTGKSSLLRMIAGLLRPAAGRVTHAGGIALADEGLALDTERTLGAALGFWARIDGADADAVTRAMDAAGIARLADVPVRMLSTGQRKRAVLARVAASGARLWLLDEPGNGLDDDGLMRLGALVAAHRAGGGAVLAASHQALPIDAPVMDLADYVPTISDADDIW